MMNNAQVAKLVRSAAAKAYELGKNEGFRRGMAATYNIIKRQSIHQRVIRWLKSSFK